MTYSFHYKITEKIIRCKFLDSQYTAVVSLLEACLTLPSDPHPNPFPHSLFSIPSQSCRFFKFFCKPHPIPAVIFPNPIPALYLHIYQPRDSSQSRIHSFSRAVMSLHCMLPLLW